MVVENFGTNDKQGANNINALIAGYNLTGT